MKLFKKLLASALLLVGASQVSVAATNLTYWDKFDVQSWGNDDGDLLFSGSWIDSQDGSATAGRMYVSTVSADGGQAHLTALKRKGGGWFFGGSETDILTRYLDLSGTAGVILQIPYAWDLKSRWVIPFGTVKDTIWLQMYNAQNGTWDTLWSKQGASSGTDTITLAIASQYRSKSSAIRFVSGNQTSGIGFFNNIDWSSSSYFNMGELRFTAAYSADHDSDGVIDKLDVDNDNDGILDINEGAINLTNVRNTMVLSGDARYEDNSTIELTDAVNGEHGTAISKEKLNFDSDFSFQANVYLGDNTGAGADGISMIFHNDPSGTAAIGAPGMDLGAVGIKDGIYVEVDTYDNHGDGVDDPTYDHVQLRDTDKAANDSSGDLSAHVAAYVYQDSGGNDVALELDNSTWHLLRMTWDATNRLMEVWFDGQKKLTLTFPIDFANIFFGGNTQVYFGFSASTGTLNNKQRVRNVTYSGDFRDTDGDGIEDYHDLDSDNDGIPDHIEAKNSADIVPIDFTAGVNAEGLPIGIENTVGTGGYIPVNTDSGGNPPYVFPDTTPDFLDTDSDGDGALDCVEGIRDDVATGKDCAITTAMVGTNGMASWAETSDDYTNPAGLITGVYPSTLSDKLVDYVDTTDEVAYREFANCGNVKWDFTTDHWITISASCNITDSVNTIFASLGTQCVDANDPGEVCDWAMYRQKVGDFSGNRNTSYEIMNDSTDTMAVSAGYWIIANADKTLYPDYNVTLTATPSPRALATNHSIGSPNFSEVFRTTYIAPTAEIQKVLLGNPYPAGFKVEDIFATNNGGSMYYPLSDDSNVSSFIHHTVYTYNHTGTDTGDYVAHVPPGVTPGFPTPIKAGQGMWMGVKSNATGTQIGIDIPYSVK